MYDTSLTYGRVAATIGAALLALMATAGAASADEWSQHASVGSEVGVGAVISRYSPSSSDGGSVLFTSIRGGYDIQENISLQLALRLWSLPGANHAVMPAVGVRVEPYRNEVGRAFVDFALGYAWTSDASNFGFDTGAGFELDLPAVPGLALGPVFRYGQVIDPAPRTSDDGRAWQIGVAATFHIGRAQAAAAAERKSAPSGPVRPFVFNVPDSDHDGVTDDVDVCPQVPVGRHRDPFRPGCPENDEDGDEISDSDDVCPLTPAGDHPDPKRKGCPFTDSDGDGIPDGDDHCPTEAGPASSDPMRNGCPAAAKAASRRSKKKAPPSEEELSAPATTSKHGISRPTHN